MKIWLINAWYWIKDLFIRELSDDEIVRKCVNKELKPYGVDYDYVITNPRIEGKEWYNYYTFKSDKEYLKWKKYCIYLLKKRYPYLTEEYIQHKFTWFDLQYSLRMESYG